MLTTLTIDLLPRIPNRRGRRFAIVSPYFEVTTGRQFADRSESHPGTRRDEQEIDQEIRHRSVRVQFFAGSSQLDQFLSTVLPSLPVTLIPGASDPATVAFPQQPLRACASSPRVAARTLAALAAGPALGRRVVVRQRDEPVGGRGHDGWRVLATGGRPVNDMFRYVDNDDRLKMMECFLRWRTASRRNGAGHAVYVPSLR